jgi:hypothetical protein
MGVPMQSTLGDFAQSVRELRTITLDPVTHAPTLFSDEDLERVIGSYGPANVLGVIGLRRSECETLRGLLVCEAPQIMAVAGCVLPGDVQQALHDEYARLVQPTPPYYEGDSE